MVDTLQDVHGIIFEFEEFVKKELGLTLDEKKAEICRFFMKGYCSKGASCPNRHTRRNDKSVVCKHWLRGLCKKGDTCEFLHEYNMKKMPECWFYSKYGECSNAECLYLHIDPESKVKECPWYAKGFCKHGPTCRHKHVKKPICPLYMTGFCPFGPECTNGHPKYDLIPFVVEGDDKQPTYGSGRYDHITCFKCGERGHFANRCPYAAQNQGRSIAVFESGS